jgi:hypothetical protein
MGNKEDKGAGDRRNYSYPNSEARSQREIVVDQFPGGQRQGGENTIAKTGNQIEPIPSIPYPAQGPHRDRSTRSTIRLPEAI